MDKIKWKDPAGPPDAMVQLARALEQETIRRAVQVKEALLVLAQHDPAYFVPYVIRVEGSGAPLLMAETHLEWQRLFQEKDRLVIWSHPDGGKTWQLIGYVLYRLGQNPNLRIAWVSRTYGQAEKPVRAVMQYISRSEELHEVFPGLRPSTHRGDSFTVHSLTVERQEISKDPSLMTCGAFGSILGARVDLLILDDPIDGESTRLPEQREKFWSWYQSTLSTRLTEHAQVIVVGNAWHPDDFLHRQAQNPRFVAKKYPVLSPGGQSSWPEHWSMADIEKKRQEVGPLLFSRLYLCNVRDDASSRFQRSWIDAALARGKGRRFSQGLQTLPAGYRTYSGVDLGVRQHSGSDPTVIFTIAVHPDGSREPLDIDAGRWQAPYIVQRIYDAHQKFFAIIGIEDNAAQDFIRQWLTGASAVPVKPFNTNRRNKLSIEFGVESLATEFAAGKWIIPEYGSPQQLQARDKWLEEMYFYDPNGHTGDYLMACWIAREMARQGTIVAEHGRKNWFR